MVYVKWVFWGLFWLILAGFLHYTLPQRDIVRVTDTYTRLTEITYPMFWSSSEVADSNRPGRDVFYIETRLPNNKPMIFRNEDTGWGWPPYFKFDTSNLQADASDMVSSKETPKWVAIRHYGWRNEFLSTYPNAITVKAVEGPDVRLIPWFNIIFLTVLAALLWGIRARWVRFKRRRIDPMIDDMADGWG